MKILNKEPLLFEYKQKNCRELFETVKIENGKIYNLEFHQKRVENAYKNFFKSKCKLNLAEVIQDFPKKNLYRAKIIYNIQGLADISYYIYSKREIKNLMLIEVPNIDYSYKYLNREIFEKINKKFNADEFIITKNGYLTDTTISNTAFYHTQKQQWHTPDKPLLYGTTLDRHIKSKKLKPKQIHYKDLKNYSKIALLNAMAGFWECRIEG